MEDSHDNHDDNSANARNSDIDNNADAKPEEDPQTQPMEIFRDYQCGNKSVVCAKLLAAKKRGFRETAHVALMKDLEYLAPGTVNNMC